MSENEEKNSNPKILMFRKDVEIIFVLKNISLYQKKKKGKKKTKPKSYSITWMIKTKQEIKGMSRS